VSWLRRTERPSEALFAMSSDEGRVVCRVGKRWFGAREDGIVCVVLDWVVFEQFITL